MQEFRLRRFRCKRQMPFDAANDLKMVAGRQSMHIPEVRFSVSLWFKS
jgi:hypothetical protein